MEYSGSVRMGSLNIMFNMSLVSWAVNSGVQW